MQPRAVHSDTWPKTKGRHRLSQLRAALEVGRLNAGRIWRHPENRGRRVRALAVYLTWQAWERVVKRPWTIRLGPDRVLRCHPHSTSASGVLYYRYPERGSMRFLLDYLRPGDGFLDVGAHIGVYALLATSVPEVRVVAFEPVLEAYRRALANVALNDVGDRVTVLRSAVGASERSVRMTVGRGTMNRVLDGHGTPAGGETQEVPMVALDSLPTPPLPVSVALMKVDVEGGEVDVLRGARKLIDRDSPALIVEVNDPDGLNEVLHDLGYDCVRYDPDAHRLEGTTPHDNVHHNVIAVREPAAAAARVAAPASER